MSPSTALTLGDWIRFDDDDHQVVGFSGPAVRLRSATGQPQIVLTGELFAADDFRRLADPPPTEERLKADADALVDSVPDDERDRVRRLEADLREVIYGYPEGVPDDPRPPRDGFDPKLKLEDRITNKAAELDISPRQLWREYEAYRDFGAWGIVDKRKVRLRDPLAGLDSRIVAAIRQQQAIEEDESTGGVDRFFNRVQRRLDKDYGKGAVVLPAEPIFRRKLAGLDRRKRTFGPATTRRTAANQPAGVHGHFTATRPGEAVMLDTTRLDVLAYDPLTGKTLSLELTIALDLATRSILAWRITPVGAKAVDAVLLLADMMIPERMRPGWDDRLRYAYSGVHVERLLSIDQRLAEAAARPVIHPEVLVVDHGKIFIGDAMKMACLRYGISLQFARLRKPTDKPEVESAFRTIRKLFSEHVAGYKGRDVNNRGLNVESTARWTPEEIEEFFAEFVVTVYQRRLHRGLFLPGAPQVPISPNDAYAAAVAVAGFIPCPPDPAMYMELLPLEWRLIHHYGVEIDGLVYNGPAVQKYRNQRSPYPDGKGQWPLRKDPRNLLHVYFKDPDDGSWHVLPWVDADDRLQPFTDRTLSYLKERLVVSGRTQHISREVAADLRRLQDGWDAPETSTAGDRRQLIRDRARAQAAARDRGRAEEAGGLQPLPFQPIPLEDGEDDIDFTDIPRFGVYGADPGTDPFAE